MVKYIYIYKRTCKLRHILVVRTCWWIDPNAIHHSKCLPTYQSPLLLFESDITKLIIIYRMNRRCEIYVSRIRHFHGTSRKVTCNQRTLALISLFHPSSNGMMFGTLVPFGFARATFDIVSSGIKIRILVLVIVVGAAHVCGMRHTGIYRYMRHTHTLSTGAVVVKSRFEIIRTSLAACWHRFHTSYRYSYQLVCNDYFLFYIIIIRDQY